MFDPVMSLVANAGALTLRELFVRAGSRMATSLQLATLLKRGELRLEPAESDRSAVTKLNITVDLTETAIAERLMAAGNNADISANVSVVPTTRAWRGTATGS